MAKLGAAVFAAIAQHQRTPEKVGHCETCIISPRGITDPEIGIRDINHLIIVVQQLILHVIRHYGTTDINKILVCAERQPERELLLISYREMIRICQLNACPVHDTVMIREEITSYSYPSPLCRLADLLSDCS